MNCINFINNVYVNVYYVLNMVMLGILENLLYVFENVIVKIVSYYIGKNFNLFLYILKILIFMIEY